MNNIVTAWYRNHFQKIKLVYLHLRGHINVFHSQTSNALGQLLDILVEVVRMTYDDSRMHPSVLHCIFRAGFLRESARDGEESSEIVGAWRSESRAEWNWMRAVGSEFEVGNYLAHPADHRGSVGHVQLASGCQWAGTSNRVWERSNLT